MQAQMYDVFTPTTSLSLSALDSADSVEADSKEKSSLAESFFGLPRARDFVHFFRRGAHHRGHGSWLHRHHKGPFRASHPDSDEEESPTSSMAGAFCKPAAFLRSQSMQSFTLSKSEDSPVLHLRLGNIVADNAEAIVAPCDPYLHHDGGCVGAINVASRGLLQSLCNTYLQKHGKLAIAEAAGFEAGGGRLKCKHVICVVGPHSRQHSLERAQGLLHASCCSVLRVALDLKVATMAVPSICAGAYGMDPTVSACTASHCVGKCLVHIMRGLQFGVLLYVVRGCFKRHYSGTCKECFCITFATKRSLLHFNEVGREAVYKLRSTLCGDLLCFSAGMCTDPHRHIHRLPVSTGLSFEGDSAGYFRQICLFQVCRVLCFQAGTS